MLHIKLNIQRFASGTIELGTSGYLTGRIVWSSSSNGSSYNSSNVFAYLQIKRTNNATTTGTFSYYFQVGSTTENSTWYGSISSSWVTIRAFEEIIIPHNNDGTGTVYIIGKVNGPTGTSLAGKTVENGSTVALDTIPRKTYISNMSGTIGSSMNISFSPSSNTFTHTLEYYFGGVSGTLFANSRSTSINWIPPVSLYRQIPGLTYGIGTLKLYTYSNGAHIGTSTSTITLYTNPAECTPVLSEGNKLEDINEITKSLTDNSGNIIVKGFSTGKITYNAKIKNYAGFKSLKINGINVNPNLSVNNDITNVNAEIQINNLSTKSVNVTLIDTRGYSLESTISANSIVEYIPLSINADFLRVTSTGGKVKILCSGNYFNESFGLINNNLELSWGVKLKKDNEYVNGGSLNPEITGNNYKLECEIQNPLQDDGLFHYTKSYDFIVYYKDKLVNASVLDSITKGLESFAIYDGAITMEGEVLFYDNKKFMQNGDGSFSKIVEEEL